MWLMPVNVTLTVVLLLSKCVLLMCVFNNELGEKASHGARKPERLASSCRHEAAQFCQAGSRLAVASRRLKFQDFGMRVSIPEPWRVSTSKCLSKVKSPRVWLILPDRNLGSFLRALFGGGPMRERGAKETAVSCRGALERDEGSDLSLRCPREQKFDSESVQGEQPVSAGKKTLLFARALATRSSGRNCSQPPYLVLWKLTFPRVFFGRAVFFHRRRN